MSDSLSVSYIEASSGLPLGSSQQGFRPGSIESLLDTVEHHASGEQDALAQYEYLRTASDDPVVALVMQLILDDEERHHGLLTRIEASLRDVLDFTQSSDALPNPTTPPPPVSKGLVNAASALIAEEHTGAHNLRDLARREADVGFGLQSLLIEMMAADSEKHARLLQFVHDRLARRCQ